MEKVQKPQRLFFSSDRLRRNIFSFCYYSISRHRVKKKKKYLPPDTKTLSELSARLLMMALCPDKFCKKLPSGNFHCLMLSGEPEANVYLERSGKKTF